MFRYFGRPCPPERESFKRAKERKPHNSDKLHHGTAAKTNTRDHQKGLAIERDMDLTIKGLKTALGVLLRTCQCDG